MKNLSIKWLSALSLLLLIGCEIETPYDGEFPEPRLAIFSFMRADSLIRVSVSSTRSIGESSDYHRRLEEVAGEVFVNEQLAGELYPRDGIVYTTDVAPKAGDRVKIVVRARGYEEAWGETIIPEEVPEIRVDTVLKENGGSLYNIRYAIRLEDSGKERLYYRLIVAGYSIMEEDGVVTYTGEDYYFDQDEEPLLSGGSNSWLDESEGNRYHIFSNDSFEGKGYTLQVNRYAFNSYESIYTNRWGRLIRHLCRNIQCVRVVRIDEASYLYLKSVMLADRGQEIVEPVQVYSNVHGGVGVIGSESYAEVSFTMPFKQEE